MKRIILTLLSLFMLFTSAPVYAEDFLTVSEAPPQLQRYKFTGTFQKVKWHKGLEAVVLSPDNADHKVFVKSLHDLRGKGAHNISHSIAACIGNPAEPYGGKVEVVAAISRMNGDWLSLRLSDAACTRLE